MTLFHRIVLTVLFCIFSSPFSFTAELPYFKIQVVDEKDGRGIPLVSLKTTNEIEYISDSNGLIAFYEPGLMDTDVHFMIFSHGYSYPKDGFGYEGVRLQTKSGGSAVIKLKRQNIAQRLYRITGQGIYRDSILLGEDVPTKQPLINGLVSGQDSTLSAIYNGKIYWFWGDTSRPAYPLGNFKTTGAVSSLPNDGGLPPDAGVDLRYFTNDEGFVKPVFSWDEPGLVWIDGVLTVKDPSGKEILMTHYSWLQNMETLLEHGLAVFDDEKEEFVKLHEFELEQTWQCPRYHPVKVTEPNGSEYFYFPGWFSMTRVKTDYESLLDPSHYEAFTCLEQGTAFQGKDTKLTINNGKPVYEWKIKTEPITGKQEKELVDAGIIKPEDTRFLPTGIESNKPVVIHGSSVEWNPYRQKWILIGTEIFGSSVLGEIWYAESDQITGPWRWAQKIITHKDYSFYNPRHHPFFDQKNGRIIFFEGTYTKTFSGTTIGTPRYDYNQIMYRLNLDDLPLAEFE